MKRTIIKAILVCMIFSFATMPIRADAKKNIDEKKNADEKTEEMVQASFININVFFNEFNITSSGKATLTASISARNVDKIKISAYLQKYQNGKWTTVKSWTVTKTGTYGVLGESYYVTSGFQYRMRTYAYVYKGGNLLESTTYVSNAKIY